MNMWPYCRDSLCRASTLATTELLVHTHAHMLTTSARMRVCCADKALDEGVHHSENSLHTLIDGGARRREADGGLNSDGLGI